MSVNYDSQIGLSLRKKLEILNFYKKIIIIIRKNQQQQQQYNGGV